MIPEQLARSCDLSCITTVERVIQSMWDDVIYHIRLAQPDLAFLAFRTLAQRMLPQETLAGLLPLVPVTAPC